MKPVAILDIGSSKVVCLCGNVGDKEGVVVRGAGICSYTGYEGGEITDKHALHIAIAEAIHKAEQESNSRIRDVALTVPTSHSVLAITDATITLGRTARSATSQDVDRLITLSYKKCSLGPEYILMHSTPVFFLVDGVASSEVPDGITTDELSGMISHMFVKEDYIKLVSDCLDDIGVEVSMCLSGQLAEAIMLIPEPERIRPAVLIDVGYMQTDVCVVEGPAMTATSRIPVGGYHFSSDLSFGLDVSLDSAEQAKRRFVFSLDYGDRVEILRTSTGSKRVAMSAISYIIGARADELVKMIASEIAKLGVNLESRPSVYITGGGLLMMRGSWDFVRSTLNYPVKRDMPWTPLLSSPNYSSAFGALDFVVRAGHAASEADEKPKDGQSEPKKRSLLHKAIEFLTK